MIASLKNLEVRLNGKLSAQEKEMRTITFPKIVEALTDFFSKLNGAAKKKVSQAEIIENFKTIREQMQKIFHYQFSEAINEYLLSRLSARVFIAVMKMVDASKITLLLEDLLAICTSSRQHKSPHTSPKMMAITCLNVTLKNFAEIENFPGGMLQDLFNALIKICKSTNDLPIKLCGINCFRYLFKIKIILTPNNDNEIIKLATKFLQEKNEELKICTVKTLNCLLVFANPADIFSYTDSIISLCLKLQDEVIGSELRRQLTFCFTKTLLIKTSKDELSSKGPKKKVEQIEKALEIMNYFTDYFQKENTLRPFFLDVLYLSSIFFKAEISTVYLKNIIDKTLSIYTKISKEGELYNVDLMFTDFIERFIAMLNQSQKMTMVDIMVHELNKIKQTMTDDAQKSQNKSKKNLLAHNIAPPIYMFYQSLILMKGYLYLIQSLGIALIDKYQKYDKISEALFPFLGFNNLQLQVATAYTFLTLVQSIPKWRTPLLSLLLNNIAMARGEILLPPQSTKVESTLKNLGALRGYCATAALLIRNVDFVDVSIPFDLANSVFDTAKCIISENISTMDTKYILAENSSYRILGWILINELMSLEYHWIGSRLKALVDLWKPSFPLEEVKTVSEAELKESLNEKLLAFRSVRKFLTNCKKLHNENILKVIGTFLCSFAGYIITVVQKSQNISTLEKFATELLAAKLEIFWSANRLHPSNFTNKFNLILQLAIEDVSNFLDDTIFKIAKHVTNESFELAKLMDFGSKNFRICTKNDAYLEFDAELKEDRKSLVEYDLAYNFRHKNARVRRDHIIREEVTFIGVAFSYQSFSNKNKMQLIKFLQSNLKTALMIKDNIIRHQKIMSLLLITFSIVDKLVETQDIVNIKNEIIIAIKEICQSCWNIHQNYIRNLVAIIYGRIFKFSKTIEYFDILINNLYESLADQTKSASISASLGYVIKYSSQTINKKVGIQIINIYQKSTRIIEYTNLVWLLHSLWLAIESEYTSSKELVNSCLTFLIINHFKLKDFSREFYFVWTNLMENLTKYAPKLGLEKSYQIDAVLTDLMETYFVSSDETHLLSRISLWSAIIFNKNTSEFLKVKAIKYMLKYLNATQLNPSPVALEKSLTLMHTLLENGDLNYLTFFEKKFNKILMTKLNIVSTMQKGNLEKFFQLFLKTQIELLKMKLTSFEDQLKFLKEVIFKSSADGEHDEKKKDDEVEKPKYKEREKVSNLKLDFVYEIDMSLMTQLYALKALENLLQITNLQIFKAKDVVNFANLVVPIIFKIASSTYDDFKEVGLKIFLIVYKKLKRYTENGEFVPKDKASDVKAAYIMEEYGAQMDALIRANLKNQNENGPLRIRLSLKLFHKFLKLMVGVDSSMVKKLFFLIANGLQQPLKLPQTTYHSERALSQILIERIQIFCKIYINLKNKNHPEFENFYPKLLRKFLEQHLLALIHDCSVIITLPRRHLKSYSNFFFFYNGTKIAYDEKQIISSQLSMLVALTNLLEEKVSTQEIINANQDQKEMCRFLSNNDRIIPLADSSLTLCVLLHYYLLCHNEIYDNVQEANSKKLKKFYESQLAEVFERRIAILHQIQYTILKFTLDKIPHINDLVNLLVIFTEVNVNQITLRTLEILDIISGMKDLNDPDIIINIASFSASHYFMLIKNNDKNDLPQIYQLFNIFLKLIIKFASFIIKNTLNSEANEEISFADPIKYSIDFLWSILLGNVETNQLELATHSQHIFTKSIEHLLDIIKNDAQSANILTDVVNQQLYALFGSILDSTVNNETRNQFMYIIMSIVGIAYKNSIKICDQIYKDICTYYISMQFAFKDFLVHLRNRWKLTKVIDYNIVQIIMAINLNIFLQFIKKSELSTDDIEYILESFKMLALLGVDNPNLKKFEYMVMFIKLYLFIYEKLINDTQSLGLIIQLGTYFINTLNPNEIKMIVGSLAQQHQIIILRSFPQTVNALKQTQQVDLPQQPKKEEVQVTAETNKPSITLKKFGRK